MKKIILIVASFLIVMIIIFAAFQFNQPMLTKNEAIDKAGIYLTIVNEKMKLDYNPKKVEESSWYIKDDFWNKVIGNTRWSGFIDGVVINIDADTGEFIEMIFPLDGVLTKKEHPDWFK